jgi:ketosteroid isomerase-like protein
MKNFILMGILIASLVVAAPAQDLKQVERDFSALSAKSGFFNALKAYMDDSLVLLRTGHIPIATQAGIAKYLESGWPTNMVLTWEPSFADKAASGDLGYTYGIYTLSTKQTDGTLSTEKGTYVSVWKLNNNGQWKLVLDTGNEGIGKE